MPEKEISPALPQQKLRRLGILADGFMDWGGGIDFIRMVVSSIAAADPDIELHLLLPSHGPRLTALRALRAVKRGFYNHILGYKIMVPKRPNSEHIAELIQGSGASIQAHLIDAGSRAIASAARNLHLEAVLPAINPLNLGKDLPWLGYIYDYQHVHLPHLFSLQEIERRNQNFARMLDRSPCVIVNASAVANDIKRYHPHHKAKVLSLPFSAAPNPAWLELSPPPLEKYGILGPYFIVSNQFWQHKDHLTIWRAFAELRDAYPEVQLVCTGETHDYRNPEYTSTLATEAHRLNITERLHILGLIPKSDQISLMRGAVAVIQATWNEGGPGGGAIYDAVSLGVPSIVSDITVNLELNEPTVRFFAKGNVEALATAMRERLQSPSYEPPSAERLIAEGLRRRRACGDTLLRAIQELQDNRYN